LFENEEVLHRSGSLPDLSAPEIDAFLDYFLSLAVEQSIFFLWRPLLVDADDDMILEFAVAAEVDYLVTHNVKDFLPSSSDFGLRVVTPSQFLIAFRAGSPS
jgi:predicted nucleic acid-binding protein